MLSYGDPLLGQVEGLEVIGTNCFDPQADLIGC